MRARSAVSTAAVSTAAVSGLLVLLSACGASLPAAVVTPGGAGSSVGCQGWYAVAGQTLYAHLLFLGDVHAASVSARLTDGSQVAPSAPVAIASGVTRQTLPLGPVGPGVVGASASVRDAQGHTSASCRLDNPH